MNSFGILSEDIKNNFEFLAEVTESPITKVSVTPSAIHSDGSNVFDFRAMIAMGDYVLDLRHALDQKFCKPDRVAQKPGFELFYNGESLDSSESTILPTEDLIEIKSNPQMAVDLWESRLKRELMAFYPDQPAFMDYESFDLSDILLNVPFEESIGNHNYYNSLYLLIMCHQKSLGVEMPPILSKQDTLREPMLEGDVEALEALLQPQLNQIKSTMRPGAYVHAKKEAEFMLDLASEQSMFNNPSISLSDKFPGYMVGTAKGSHGNAGYSLLVIEDIAGWDGNNESSIGVFGNKVLGELNQDGRYNGTHVLATFNLGMAMEICSTGQIDAIIMDGNNNSNIMDQITLTNDPEYLDKSTQVINLEFSDKLPETPKEKGIVLKHEWQKKIYDHLENQGIEKKPYSVVVQKEIKNYSVLPFINEVLKPN